MDIGEFDKFADEYRAMHATNIAISGESPDFFADYKIRDVARIFQEAGIAASVPHPRILDFGAGIGTSVPFFRKYFPAASLTCLDVSTKSLELGESRFHGEAEFVAFDGNALPFDDGRFDIVFAACVFHHIDHAEHVRLVREMSRVLAPGGFAVIFEHNPLNPLTVRAVNTCPFDENARLLGASTLKKTFESAGFRQPRHRYRIFFPHFARMLRPLEQMMAWLPLGAQYYVYARK